MTIEKQCIQAFKNKGLTIATAESVSGGFVSYLLTKTPGSSRVFKGGVVVYSLASKGAFFDIPASSLKKNQGVSSTIAVLLAKGARELFNADIGISLVGFAGPQAKKGIEVGTVFMAVADSAGSQVKKRVIKDSRAGVRKKASRLLIEMAYNRIK